MTSRTHLAIVGSGASAIYLLKHLLDTGELMTRTLRAISIFDQSRLLGTGMPYSPLTTDRYHMSNISSEELPELPVSLVDWLRAQEQAVLQALHLDGVEITADGIYSRLALGQYLSAQYRELVAEIRAAGVEVHEHPGCQVVDVRDHPAAGKVTLATKDGQHHEFDGLTIATGHAWTGQDRPAAGYYASPWPIRKLLPEPEGAHFNFPVGTLGASLSAFDVVSSLAHRHGVFHREPDGRMVYQAHPGTEGFRIVMHAVKGLLPHLQYAQSEPMRDIYRHVTRQQVLALVDAQGFLRLDTYFDQVCRPVLVEAFEKDGEIELSDDLSERGFSLHDLIEKLTDRHTYANPFEGMRQEMEEARNSVENDRPIYWKEALDDLVYTLNYHAGLLCAEDHVRLHQEVMPFLMNIVAAMPLDSGESILALYDAGRLSLVEGKVEIAGKQDDEDATTITVEQEDGTTTTERYRLFVDCSGQKPLEEEDYPFPSLIVDGTVRAARARFAGEPAEELRERAFQERDGGPWLYPIGGIDIDDFYGLIGQDGQANPRISDIAFPHATGVRPYSYGLQACSDTAAILVNSCGPEHLPKGRRGTRNFADKSRPRTPLNP